MQIFPFTSELLFQGASNSAEAGSVVYAVMSLDTPLSLPWNSQYYATSEHQSFIFFQGLTLGNISEWVLGFSVRTFSVIFATVFCFGFCVTVSSLSGTECGTGCVPARLQYVAGS